MKLPGSPAHVPASFAVEEFRVVWRGVDGAERELSTDGSASGVEVEIPKHPGLAVLVYAHYRDSRFVSLPAAAVFPYDLDGKGRLEARYERGFAGVVLHQVLFGLPSFNTKRFVEATAERGEGNPWLLDRERVVDRLMAGRFSTIYLRLRERFPVTVSAPPGVYVADNLLVAPRETEADGSIPVAAGSDEGTDGELQTLSLVLPAGHHNFARVGEGGAPPVTFSVVVGPEGEAEVFFR